MISKSTFMRRCRRLCLAGLLTFFMTTLIACGDSTSVNDSATDSDSNASPVAAIETPEDGSLYTYGDIITFTGTGTDSEDGTLFGTSLIWSSDLDGELGAGTGIEVSNLSLGDHSITLTVTDSSGISDSDEIVIYVKAWDIPISLSDNISPDGTYANIPQTDMDDNGNAIVVWIQSDGSSDQIFKSEYRNGSWTHPTGLDDNISPDGQNSDSPRVAMDKNGNAIIVWRQSDGSSYQIFKSEHRNGSWTHPTGLDDNISPDGTSVFVPNVALDDNGNAIIVWYQSDGSNYQIFKSEYRNGSWTHPADSDDNISLDRTGALAPQVAMDDNGNAIIVWNQSDGSNNRIFKSEYRNGFWTHPVDSDDSVSPEEERANSTKVAMDDNGNAIIVWRQSYGKILKSEYRNGSWTHPSDSDDKISLGETGALVPQVAMDNNGNAIIVWYQSDGSNNRIFKSEYRNGSWTHPADSDDSISPDGTRADGSEVAMDNNGNAIIVWRQSDGRLSEGNITQIFKSEYRNGSWAHPTDSDDNISFDGTNAFAPQVAMDNNGNAIIIWYQSDGSNGQIFKSEYY